jgi:hypothetical protein
MERVMSKHNAMDETSALQKVMNGRSRSAAVLLATASLFGLSVGFACPAVASQLPRISTPQVKVNTSVHMNTANVHPVTGTNSNTLKITNAHQFDKNNGNKGKGGNTPSNAGSVGLKIQGIDGESKDTGTRSGSININ